MAKYHNSWELARQVAAKMGLGDADELELYKELSQMPNGHVKDVLAALTAPENPKETSLQKYAACIKSDCIHDAQYSKQEDPGPLDDDAWMDAEGQPLFLKVIEAETPARAKQIAAAYAGVSEEVIALFPM